MILLLFLASVSIAAPLFPRQLVLPGAGGTNYWWPSATTSTSTYASSITSVSPSSTLMSTSIISSPISSNSPSPTSLIPLSAAVTPAKPFHILYLIPLFAVVGLLALGGILWLIHGCCTRKPKYRPPPPLPPPQNISFKAFRYEDISPVDTQTQYTHEENHPHQCQHVREYGFKCDCGLQAESHDQNWPSDSIDRRDGNHVEKKEVEEARGSSCLDVRLNDEAKPTRGFRMVDEELITSSSPLSQLSTRINTSSNGSWMEKVVYALGSRFSSSSGQDEDRYTAIPESSASGQRRTDKLKKHAKKRKSKKASMRRSLNRLSVLSDQTSTTVVPGIVTTAAASKEEEEDDDDGRVVLLSQRRRLQNHRESIASLPAGMVFSPPVVAFSVFGEEDGSMAAATTRDKSVPNVLLR